MIATELLMGQARAVYAELAACADEARIEALALRLEACYQEACADFGQTSWVSREIAALLDALGLESEPAGRP